MLTERFSSTPTPPYYAVIFSSQASEDGTGYAAMAEQMMALALAQPGCLGAETVRDDDGFGITVSYWRTEADIVAWKAHAKHALAQRLGQEKWYSRYTLRVAKVERDYSGPVGRTIPG